MATRLGSIIVILPSRFFHRSQLVQKQAAGSLSRLSYTDHISFTPAAYKVLN